MDLWGIRSLAYRIKGQKQGIYYYIRFLATQGLVDELEKRLKITEPVLRYLTVKLGEMPASAGEMPGRAPKRGAPDAAEIGGLTLESLSKAHRRRYRIPDTVTQGVVVTGVRPGSAGSKAGLMRGDVILQVDRKKVDGTESLRRAWKAAKGRVLLVVSRQGRTLFLVAKP